MDDIVFDLDGGADIDTGAVVSHKNTAVAGLATTRVIENRAVKDDAAPLVDGNNSCLTVPKIGIVTKQFFRTLSHRLVHMVGVDFQVMIRP